MTAEFREMWADVKTPLEADLPKLLAARAYHNFCRCDRALIVLTFRLVFSSSRCRSSLHKFVVGHKVDPRETAKKTAVKGPNKKKKRTGARNVSKLTNVHLLEKVSLLFRILDVISPDRVTQGIDLSKDYVPE